MRTVAGHACRRCRPRRPAQACQAGSPQPCRPIIAWRTEAGSLPRQLKRQERPGVCPALALAVAVAFVGKLQAKALRILLQATRHSPGAKRTALFPATVRSPNCLSALAARKR